MSGYQIEPGTRSDRELIDVLVGAVDYDPSYVARVRTEATRRGLDCTNLSSTLERMMLDEEARRVEAEERELGPGPTLMVDELGHGFTMILFLGSAVLLAFGTFLLLRILSWSDSEVEAKGYLPWQILFLVAGVGLSFFGSGVFRLVDRARARLPAIVVSATDLRVGECTSRDAIRQVRAGSLGVERFLAEHFVQRKTVPLSSIRDTWVSERKEGERQLIVVVGDGESTREIAFDDLGYLRTPEVHRVLEVRLRTARRAQVWSELPPGDRT